MTQAVCLACGKLRFGAFTLCTACGYRPGTGWELAVSIACSDSRGSGEHLEAVSEAILAAREHGGTVSFDSHPSTERFIWMMLKDPSARDMLTLHGRAKDGFWRKQLNWHFIGPNGYRAEVVTRGRELPRKAFDELAAEAGRHVFFSTHYENGEGASHQVTKDVWYCMRDLFLLMERRIREQDLFRRWIDDQAARFTLRYLLEARNIDLRPIYGA